MARFFEATSFLPPFFYDVGRPEATSQRTAVSGVSASFLSELVCAAGQHLQAGRFASFV